MADVKILLVEDENIEAMDIKLTLESFGYEVPYIASSSEEAVEKALAIMPDLILMDIILKGEIDGIETVSKIRDLNIPVIYLTAHSEESTIERAKLTEPYGYIIKPYDRIELKYAIELAIYKNKLKNKLKDSETKYRTLFNQASDGILLMEGDKFIECNDRALEIYGTNREQLIGKTPYSVFSPKVQPNKEISEDMAIEYINKALDGHPQHFEWKHLKYNGTPFYTEISLNRLKIKGQYLLQAIVRDITDRKKVEELFQEEDDKFRSILDAMPDGVCIFNSDYEVEYINPVIKKDFGHVEGKKCFEYLHESNEICPWCKNKEVFQGKSIQWEWNSIKTGKSYELLDKPLKNPDGTISKLEIFHDITKRKIADKALIESQQRLSEIIDFLPDATLAIDVEGKVIAWNRAMEEMTGFKAENIIGKENYEYSLPFYRKRRPILIDLVLKFDKEIENYYRFIKREGNALLAETEVKLNDKNFILWIKAVPLYDRDGNINGAIESIRDITQHKLDESALKRSEERFRAVAESAVDAIVTTDANGNIIFFNNSLTKIFGYTKEQLKGKPLTLLMPERFKKNYLNELEKFKKSGQHRLMGKTVTTTGLKKDQNEFPFEMSLSAWKSEGKTYFTSIIRDLTERKKAENAELQYQSLFDNMLNGFAYCKMIFKEDRPIDFIYLDVNQAFESLTGLKDVTGKKVSEVIPLIQESDPELLEIYGRVSLTGQPETFEIYVESLKMWFSISVYSPRKEFFVAVFDVITERKEAEEKIKSSLKEKEVLLQEIHHRVKNNMQIISSLLNLQTKYVDAEESVNILRESQNRVKSMAMIHEKLYQSDDLTHIQFVDYIPSLVLNLFYSYNVEITQIEPIFEIEDISLNMETAVPCGLIISELVSNSLKYAFPNGRKGEVRVSLKSEDDKYELIISDSGIGLPEKLDFDNLESLGLSLVNSLTEQIDGEITINISHGTEFKITFKELSYKDRI
ncbi:PAS domain S-box protein [Methanobacterium sp. SMA-27]|uniref:PAS domain S-box protein n=1 Tax=Methanobacterium sp. SMA-27 TaxID=1495336 RepID=UPI00069482F2|nr:PAS domain S-box protein [Methanobacterium sp. SMA-27]